LTGNIRQGETGNLKYHFYFNSLENQSEKVNNQLFNSPDFMTEKHSNQKKSNPFTHAPRP